MHLIDALLDLCNQVDRPIIAVDGPAGAGKTTLAGSIGQGFSQRYSVRTIHMDDLYNGWDNALGDELTHTLETITSAHLSGLPIPLKTYDWATCEFREAITLEPRQLLILEGVGSGQKAVREKSTALIWIEIDHEIGLKRVLQRDGAQYEAVMKRWLTSQSEYFQRDSTQENAEFILTNE